MQNILIKHWVYGSSQILVALSEDAKGSFKERSGSSQILVALSEDAKGSFLKRGV